MMVKEEKTSEEQIIRNIILIGRTGNGKSTIANVLSGTDKFKEGKYSVSQTENTQIEEAEITTGIKYRIIDTVGIGDTRLSEVDVLNKIAEAAYMAKDGLNQIFFVTKGRFTKEEIEVYKILRKVIFNRDVVKFTTIVKTNFPYCQEDDECEEDKKKMIEDNKSLSEVIRSCRKVLYVNNPPTNIKNERMSEINKEERKYSKKILITHLATCKDVYKPPNFDKLNDRIGDHVSEKELIKKLLKDKDLNDEERKKFEEKIRKLEEKIASKTKGFFETVTALPGKVVDKTVEGAIEIVTFPFGKEMGEKITSHTNGFFEKTTSLPGKVIDKAFEGVAEVVSYPFRDKDCNIS